MMGVAMPASRSLIALLIGTVVFFALWMVALKPSSSHKSGSPAQGVGSFQSAINKAHQAVTTSNKNDAASGNENAAANSGGASTSTSSRHAGSATHSATSTGATHGATASTTKQPTAAQKQSLAANMSTVKAAVSAHKVVALLFYNPGAADDQAVKQELASVPTHKGQVVKLAIPVNESAKFTAVTQQIAVNLTPTLVLLSKTGNASEIVGYSSPFEIDQRVADALTAG